MLCLILEEKADARFCVLSMEAFNELGTSSYLPVSVETGQLRASRENWPLKQEANVYKNIPSSYGTKNIPFSVDNLENLDSENNL